MKAQLLSLILVAIGFSAFAEVKAPGTFVASQCGTNDLKTAGPSVTSVCVGQVVGPIVGTSSSALAGVAVTVNKGAVTMKYFYQYYTPVGLGLECGRAGFDTRCMKHARLVGVIGHRNLVDFTPAATLPKDETVVYTLTGQFKRTLSSEFLKLKFEAGKLTVVVNSMSL